MNLLDTFKKIVDESGKTQYEIAKNAEIPSITLSRWYRGDRKINLSLLKMLKAISKDNDDDFLNKINELLNSDDEK